MLRVGVLVTPTASDRKDTIYGTIAEQAIDNDEPLWSVDWPDSSEWEFSDDIEVAEACDCGRPASQCPTYPCRVVS